MTQNVVEMPIYYFGDFTKGRPIFNADIFVGEPDTDPEILINQKQVTLQLEDGTEVPVSQPINTGPGGYVTHNGSAATMFVDGNYSIKVLNSLGAQIYYFENFFSRPASSGISASRVDTVADMVATSFAVGEFVDTSGYNAIGDAGNNSYEIEANTGQSIDGGQYILLNNGNVASGLFPGGKIYANQFGASSTLPDSSAAIQAATDFLASTVGGFLYFAEGSYASGQIIMKDRVIYVGDSIQSTVIRAIDNLNDHLFISDGFSSLTLQNKWLSSEGVLEFIGFRDIRIDGNKANQSAGDGVRLYAKGLFFDNVTITNCFGNGLYSEAGENGAVGSYISFPEGKTGWLMINNCDGHGWDMRGPHDMYVTKVVSALNGGDGIRAQSVSGQFLATVDFDFVHCYSNTGRGLYVIDSTVRASLCRLENSGEEGLALQSSDYCEFGTVHLFDNCKTSGSYQGSIDGNSRYNTFGEVLIRRAGLVGVGGMTLDGNNNKLSINALGDVTGGGNSTGRGLNVGSPASHNKISAVISGFSGVGGVALRTANSGGINWNIIEASLQDSTTLWINGNQGNNNGYRITGNCTAPQNKFFGVGPNNGSNRELWDITLRDSTPDVALSEEVVKDSVDLNTTTEQILTLGHNLLVAPQVEDVQLSLNSSGTNTTWAVQYMKVQSVTTTDIVVHLKLTNAAGVAQTGEIQARVRL